MSISAINSLHVRRIAAVSPRVRVAHVQGNVETILDWATRGESEGVDVLLFPELSITGYTVGDLVRWPDLLHAAEVGLHQLAEWTRNHSPLLIVGLPVAIDSYVFNCAAVVGGGCIHGLVPKTYLPSTHEYYDNRWFTSGAMTDADHVMLDGVRVPFGTDLLFTDPADPASVIGIEICEDLWAVEPPSGTLARLGATILLNLSASNELVGKHVYRKALVCNQAARCYAAYAYASAGPTESTSDTVFSGHCIVNECGELLVESGRLILQGAWAVADVDLERIVSARRNSTSFNQHAPWRTARRIEVTQHVSEKHALLREVQRHPFVPVDDEVRLGRCAEILQIQATALAVRLNVIGAKKLVLGLSGGLDSTWALLVCCEACEILGIGHDAVLAISMPGFGTSSRTQSNAKLLATNMNVSFTEISITSAVVQHFADIGHDVNVHDVVYENAQARERTQVLMDMANKVNGFVVGTGDLSEMALGWSTYNGDHMSMYGVNSGVPKTLIKHLVSWYAGQRATKEGAAILNDILQTPISPELLPLDAAGGMGQFTEEVLGPYEVHDFFLYYLVRQERSVRSTAILAALAFDGVYSTSELLDWLEIFIRRFWSSQFKRNCQPDGVKIGSVALSPRTDWRMPSDASESLWMAEFSAIRPILG